MMDDIDNYRSAAVLMREPWEDAVIHAAMRADALLDQGDIRTRRPPFMLVPEVGGVLYLRTATSKLPWKAKTATLMVGTSGHLGNVGSWVVSPGEKVGSSDV